MIHKLVVAAFALSTTLPTLAHEVDCEKNVGILATDAQAETSAARAGPVFATAPTTVLTLDTYPVTIGWVLRVTNLAQEPSRVDQLQDDFFAASGGTVIGPFQAVPFWIPAGEAVTSIVAQRIGSYEECLALGGVDGEENVALCDGSSPVCRGTHENRFIVTTETNIAECRAHLVCAPPRVSCLAPQWTGFKVEDSDSRTEAFGVAVACDGTVQAAGGSGPAMTNIRTPAIFTFDRTGSPAQPMTWTESTDAVQVEATSIAIDGSGRRIVSGSGNANGYISSMGFVRAMEPDGTLIWDHLFDDGVTIAVDANAYIYALSRPSAVAPHDPIVTKLAPDGSLVWTKTFGTTDPSAMTVAMAIAVTGAGDVFVAGRTDGAFSGQVPPLEGGVDPFLARIDGDGNLVWVRQLPGTTGGDLAGAVAVDALGNSVITGVLDGNAFVATYDPAGNPRWSRNLPSTERSASWYATAMDATGAVWVAGARAPTDTLVARYDSSGNLLWVTSGTGLDISTNTQQVLLAITIDAEGFGIVAGAMTLFDYTTGRPTIISEHVVVGRLRPDGTY